MQFAQREEINPPGTETRCGLGLTESYRWADTPQAPPLGAQRACSLCTRALKSPAWAPWLLVLSWPVTSQRRDHRELSSL